MYLEQRVEELERQMREFKEQKKSEQALRMGKLIRIPMSQFEEKEGTEQSWKDIVFKGA